MSQTQTIPANHPGLDAFPLQTPEELKRQCPAFAAGCPYAKVDEAHPLPVGVAELSKWYNNNKMTHDTHAS